MKKIIVLLLLVSSFSVGAQVLGPDGPRAYKKENTKQEVAVALTHIREADVTWAKRVWRTIDLRQKQNLPLYHPLQSSADQLSSTLGKRSFIQVIYDILVNDTAINNMRAFKTYELREQITSKEAVNKFAACKETNVLDLDPATGDCYGTITLMKCPEFLREIKPYIVKVHLMEDWFFDKERSVMDVRILALGIEIPVFDPELALQYCTGTGVTENVFDKWKKADAKVEVWFFFPDLRAKMAKTEIYNRHNDAHRTSFDDLFLKRMFSSYITKEENVYDREINDYTGGLDALLEAEKISEKIRDFEMNFWQY